MNDFSLALPDMPALPASALPPLAFGVDSATFVTANGAAMDVPLWGLPVPPEHRVARMHTEAERRAQEEREALDRDIDMAALGLGAQVMACAIRLHRTYEPDLAALEGGAVFGAQALAELMAAVGKYREATGL